MSPVGQNTYSYNDFILDVTQGIISGYSCINKFGRNDDIDSTSGFEAIWNGGGSYTGQDPIAAETLEIFSSDVNDDAAGTGARTVRIFGLDENWVEQTEEIIMDGTTAVDTVNTYIRQYRARVLTAGSGLVNAGDITARQKTTTANITMVLPSGYNSTMIAAFTIPANKTGYIVQLFAVVAGKTIAESNVQWKVRPFGETYQVQEEFTLLAAGSSYINREYSIPKGPYTAKTDIVVEADTNQNNTGIAAGFGVILIDS